jgi:hypothetical protein
VVTAGACRAANAEGATENVSRWGTGLIFPGKGKKIYARLRMFERIHKRTGIRVTPRDLRDYFGT